MPRCLVWFVPLIAVATAAAQVPYVALSEGFESGSAGSAPSATSVSPTSPVGATDAVPGAVSTTGPRGVVVGPYAGSPALPAPGTGSYVRIYDYDTDSGAALEYDFVPAEVEDVTAVRVSFAFAATADLGTASKNLRFSVTSWGLSVGSGANRPFLLTLANNGTGKLDVSGTGSDVTLSFDPAKAHRLVLYANDHDSEVLAITGPDGVARSVAANTVMVFLDEVLKGSAPFDATGNFRTTPSNLGRVGFTTLTSESSIDFAIDDLEVQVLRGHEGDATPTVPSGFGSGTASYGSAVYDPAVLLWEKFGYGTDELRSGSSVRWSVGSGAPKLTTEDGAAIFDYAGTATNEGVYTRAFSGGRQVVRAPADATQPGPVLYRAFTLTVDRAPAAGAVGWFLAQQGVADAATLNGLVWLRAGAMAGTYRVGVSTDALSSTNATANADNAVFATRELAVGTSYRIVTRYDAATNDSALWIDAADEVTSPDARAAKTDDQGTYAYSGLALRISNAGGTDLGKGRLAELRAATSFAAARSTADDVVEPPAEIRRNGSNLSIWGRDFDVFVTGNHQITYLRHAGEYWLAPEGGRFTASGSATVQNTSLQGSFFYKQFMLQEVVAGGMEDQRYTVVLTNNHDTATATYRLAIDANVAVRARLGDGTTGATPLATADAGAAGEVSLFDADGRRLRLTGFDRLTAGTGSLANRQFLWVDVPPRSVRRFSAGFARLAVDSPADWQVFQRSSRREGVVNVAGAAPEGTTAVTVSFVAAATCAQPLKAALPSGEQAVALETATGKFSGGITLPAGGWYAATVKAWAGTSLISEYTVPRFGVGEVFVGAGQSNSTNSDYANSDDPNSAGPTQPLTGLVASFSGANWQEARDPQPGPHDTTTGGSYYPAFGDLMAARFSVPVAVAVTGQGSTQVIEWLPTAAHDFTDFASSYHNGLYDWLMARAGELGAGGFRAVLWHQGESDSTHTAGTTRTSRADYHARLKTLIEQSRADAGWNFPWFVARASAWPLDTPEGDPNIQGAQAQLWTEGVALEGADTDALGLDYRDLGGSRVHFSSPVGTSAHGAAWAEKVGDWLDAQFDGAGALDSDGGGAPDYWERAFGLDPDSAADDAADPDGDGLSNAAEFLTGGDPYSRDQAFLAKVQAAAGGGLEVRYRARAGRTYVLETRAALDAGGWSELARVVASADDTGAVFVVQPGADPTGFYRVRVEAP